MLGSFLVKHIEIFAEPILYYALSTIVSGCPITLDLRLTLLLREGWSKDYALARVWSTKGGFLLEILQPSFNEEEFAFGLLKKRLPNSLPLKLFLSYNSKKKAYTKL